MTATQAELANGVQLRGLRHQFINAMERPRHINTLATPSLNQYAALRQALVDPALEQLTASNPGYTFYDGTRPERLDPDAVEQHLREAILKVAQEARFRA